MIFRSAIDDYLKRARRDLGKYKSWSTAKIDAKLSALDPPPKFYTKPRNHQKVCFYLLTRYPCELELLDMGLGKTKIVLDAIRWHKALGGLNRVLVLVPNVVNLEGWRMEIAKHAPDLTAAYLDGNRQDRMESLEEETDLCLATYAGLTHVVCTRAGGKMRIDKSRLGVVKKLFDGIVWDESTCLMNPRSLQFKIASQMSATYGFRVGLTGTPLGRDPQVLWPQFFAVDRGESLGASLGIFRQTFFHEHPGYWGGIDRTFKKKMTQDLHRMMSHSSIRYSAAECLDLPPKVVIDRPFAMTAEQWSYYNAILEQAVDCKIGNKMLDIGGIFVRLRQITSGFVSLDGTPSPLSENPKMDSLMELVDELPEDEKVVIFHEFIWTGNQIVAAMKSRKIKTARLYSGTKDKQGELRRFMTDPACRVFAVNSQSGAHGINLQAAHYVVFYESPVSPIVRQQAEARCLRQGQENTVFMYDLAARHTVDQKILRFLSEGKDLFSALVEGGVGLLEEE